MERRKESVIKTTLLPVVVAVVTGSGSGYVGVTATLSVVETRINYVEKDVIKLSSMLEKINENQTELAVRGQWIISTDRRIIYLEDKIKKLDGE